MSERSSGSGWVIAAVVAGAGVLLVAVLAAAALVALRFLAAAEPYPLPPKIEMPKITTGVVIIVLVEGSKGGGVKYHVGGEDPVEGEKALTELVRKRVAELRKSNDEVSMKLQVIDYAGITNDTLRAAKAACEAGGAKVEKLPDPKSIILLTAKGHEKLDVEITRVEGDVLHFRFEGRDVKGTAALVEAVRRKIAALAKERGGPVLVHPSIKKARGVRLSRQQDEALSKALFAAGPEVQGIRSSGSRTRTVKRMGPEPLKEKAK